MQRARSQDPLVYIGAIAFCGFFAFAGAVLAGWIPLLNLANPQSLGLGVVFVAFSSFMVIGLVKGLYDLHCHETRLLQNLQQLWLADYPWNPGGIAESSSALKFSFIFGILTTVFVVGFAQVWDDGIFALCFLSLFPLLSFGYMSYLLIRAAKFGRGFVRFERFPYFLGDEIKLAWRSGKPLGRFNSMSFTLRYIEESQKKDDSGEWGTQTVEIYAQTIALNEPGEKNDMAEVLLTFTPPDLTRTSGTKLFSETPRYWELEVLAATPGLKYCERFLVPVYEAKQTPGVQNLPAKA